MQNFRDRHSRLDKNSFHWHGRNRDGVAQWTGNAEGPPAPLGWLFTWYGVIAGIGGIAALIIGPILHLVGNGIAPLILVGMIHGAVFGGVGIWATRFRRHISALKQPDAVCEALGIDNKTLEVLAEERGIKPKLIINDQPLYDLAEFSDAHTLLRGSSAPVSPDSLLRAAMADSRQTPASELLRAADTGTESQNGSVPPWRSGTAVEHEPQEQIQKAEV
jgi:hypothetical protein